MYPYAAANDRARNRIDVIIKIKIESYGNFIGVIRDICGVELDSLLEDLSTGGTPTKLGVIYLINIATIKGHKGS